MAYSVELIINFYSKISQNSSISGYVKTCLPEKNRVSEVLSLGKEQGMSNIPTGKELVFQIFLPEKKWSFKYSYRKRIGPSNIPTGRIGI